MLVHFNAVLLDDVLEVMRAVPEDTCNNRADEQRDPAAEQGEVDYIGAFSTSGLSDGMGVADKAKEDEIVEESASHEETVSSPVRPLSFLNVRQGIDADTTGCEVHKVRSVEQNQARQHSVYSHCGLSNNSPWESVTVRVSSLGSYHYS